MVKFLDQAGLVALWAKIKALIGNGALKVSSNSGSATTATTTNEKTDKTLQIKGDGTWISGAVSGSNGAAVVTLSHGAASTGSALSTSTSSTDNYSGSEIEVVKTVTASADSKGHITGVAITKQKVPGKATDTTFGTVKVSNVKSSAVNLAPNGIATDRNYGVQIDSDGLAFVTVPWTDSQNVGDDTLKISGDTGPSVSVFSANSNRGSDRSIEFRGGTNINTESTYESNNPSNPIPPKIIINHEAISTTTSDNAINGVFPANIANNINVITGVELTMNNGHVTNIKEKKTTLNLATQVAAGLMSAADKEALDNLNNTIATALTSAITPSGTKTASEFAALVALANNTILSSTNLGNLYTISTPLVIGPAQSGDTTFTNAYTYFVEGASLTQNGSVRYEIPAGTNLLIVNTGTAQNPSYKIDIMGTYDNTYWSVNSLKAIPVDSDDSDYEIGDQTIESICV